MSRILISVFMVAASSCLVDSTNGIRMELEVSPNKTVYENTNLNITCKIFYAKDSIYRANGKQEFLYNYGLFTLVQRREQEKWKKMVTIYTNAEKWEAKIVKRYQNHLIILEREKQFNHYPKFDPKIPQTGTFQLNNLTVADMGDYACIYGNKYEQMSNNVTVRVIPAPNTTPLATTTTKSITTPTTHTIFNTSTTKPSTTTSTREFDLCAVFPSLCQSVSTIAPKPTIFEKLSTLQVAVIFSVAIGSILVVICVCFWRFYYKEYSPVRDKGRGRNRIKDYFEDRKLNKMRKESFMYDFDDSLDDGSTISSASS